MRWHRFKGETHPKGDKTAYSQSLPMPIHLKEDLIVELNLMHKYGINTVLTFSKYTSPAFARRKPNRKLRLHVDLRKYNSLLADDYTINKQSSSKQLVRRSTTLGREVSIVQARLLPGLSLI